MSVESDAAGWMRSELDRTGYLEQKVAVYGIQQRFGAGCVYNNAAGNLAISREVLAEFRKLTGDEVVWERGGAHGASDRATTIIAGAKTDEAAEAGRARHHFSPGSLIATFTLNAIVPRGLTKRRRAPARGGALDWLA